MHDEQLDVGYIAGAHGVRGWVRLKFHDPGSAAARPGTALILHRDGEVVARAEVQAVVEVPGKPGMVRAQLSGVRGRDAAEALRGSTVAVKRSTLPPLADDEFYLGDAMGLPVVRASPPCALGKIVAVSSNGVQDLFEVEWIDSEDRKHHWLLPVLPALIVSVDGERVQVELPAGFLPQALELTP